MLQNKQMASLRDKLLAQAQALEAAEKAKQDSTKATQKVEDKKKKK